MQSITFVTRTDPTGTLRLEIPTDLADRQFEVVVVLQPLIDEPVDAMGYPIGYFEQTYGAFAHDPLVREQPTEYDTRDTLE